MRKLNLSILTILFVAFTLSSCIDDEAINPSGNDTIELSTDDDDDEKNKPG